VKTRAFVSGGGKKPFKQKGTGNARQGSTRSPLMPGGAVLHGPVPRDYRQYVSKKTKRLALCVALSDKIRHGRLVIVDDFKVEGYKTAHMLGVIKGLERQGQKILIADEGVNDRLYTSSRNIKCVNVVSALLMSAEDVLRQETLIISEAAVKSLGQRLHRGSQEETK
jgi:large subunit ribosomal protein L4